MDRSLARKKKVHLLSCELSTYKNLVNVSMKDGINKRSFYCSGRSLGCQLGNYGNALNVFPLPL